MPHLPHTPGPPDFDWDYAVFDQAYEWVRALRGVPQNPVFHAEGDVWIHTRMVLEALTQDPQWQELPDQERAMLFWACLLHDVAKPACLRMENGIPTSPRHAVVGARMTREILWKGVPDPVPFPVREVIVNWVRYHGLPLWLLEKRNGTAQLLQASLLCNLRLLQMLARADALGRICPDQQDLLDRLEMFGIACEEHNCKESPFPFASDLARFRYFQRPDGSPLYEPYDDTWGEVILMSGLPGAGKDHWISNHAPAIPVISLDGIRKELKIGPTDNQGKVIQLAKQRARELLRSRQPFVWNATNITRNIRKPLVDLFATYKAKVKIVYIESPYTLLRKQNRERKESVPEKVIEKLIRKLEVPDLTEAHIVEYVY